MRFILCSDEALPVVDHVAKALLAGGHDVEMLATQAWAKGALAVGHAVASGHADQGIVFCHTGTGVSIAANKVNGVRAALCVDAETAAGARKWNDANVLALSLRLVTPEAADAILGAWLANAYAGTEEESLGAIRAEDAEDTG
jgi:ribose 5-phosphate isomerase B